jgi:acyl-CoA oxidase
MAKIDASVATFLVVHNCLGMSTIDKCGSEEQRAKFLPKLISLDQICCWGLTEPDYGSDATGLKSSAKPVKGGFILNGTKRWIGNATISGN